MRLHDGKRQGSILAGRESGRTVTKVCIVTRHSEGNRNRQRLGAAFIIDPIWEVSTGPNMEFRSLTLAK